MLPTRTILVYLVIVYMLPTYLRIWAQYKLAWLTFKLSVIGSNSMLLNFSFSLRIWSTARLKEADAELCYKLKEVGYQETNMFKFAKVKKVETYVFAHQDDLEEGKRGYVVYRNLSPEEEAKFQDTSMDVGFDGQGRKAKMVIKQSRMSQASLDRLIMQIESFKNVVVEDDDGNQTPYVWNGSSRETRLNSWGELPKGLREEITAAINNDGVLPKDFGKKDEDDDATEEGDPSQD